uniref:Uncharacterized protein n=1 Tax=Rhizophora mucronata TaxID=61149 RepID=A0A2P2IR37_RHIMU
MANNKSDPFPNQESLLEWLKTRLPRQSLASWGTENVHNLWIEVSLGESTLSDLTPPLRTLHRVVVRVLHNKTHRILLESRQELSDGSVRPRSRPLSKEMKAGESVEEAASRAMKQQLGSNRMARVVPGTYKIKEEVKVEEEEPGSYPGLTTRYVVHTVDARVEGLPDEDFATEEEMLAAKVVQVKKHYWKWAESNYVEE